MVKNHTSDFMSRDVYLYDGWLKGLKMKIGSFFIEPCEGPKTLASKASHGVANENFVDFPVPTD